MIVDLSMPPDGLTAAEKEESHGGMLTGWLWLRNYVLPIVPAGFRQRVIICSQYVRDFEKLVPADEYRGIRPPVEKRGSSNSAEEILGHVREISRLAE